MANTPDYSWPPMEKRKVIGQPEHARVIAGVRPDQQVRVRGVQAETDHRGVGGGRYCGLHSEDERCIGSDLGVEHPDRGTRPGPRDHNRRLAERQPTGCRDRIWSQRRGQCMAVQWRAGCWFRLGAIEIQPKLSGEACPPGRSEAQGTAVPVAPEPTEIEQAGQYCRADQASEVITPLAPVQTGPAKDATAAECRHKRAAEASEKAFAGHR